MSYVIHNKLFPHDLACLCVCYLLWEEMKEVLFVDEMQECKYD